MLTDNYKNFIISTVTQNNSGVVNIVTINYSKKNDSKKVTRFCCWTAESDKKDEEQNCPWPPGWPQRKNSLTVAAL